MRCIAVSIMPGAIELTRMPCGASATAAARVIASTAAFDAAVRQGHARGRRGDVDDAAALLLHHDPAGRRASERQRLDVETERAVPGGGFHLEEGFACAEARIVDQDVEPAEQPRRVLDGLLGARDQVDNEGLPTARIGYGFCAHPVDVGDDDFCSPPAGCDCDHTAQAARRTCYQKPHAHPRQKPAQSGRLSVARGLSTR
jgi:hypothetical protein